jgi:hypothetical protein
VGLVKLALGLEGLDVKVYPEKRYSFEMPGYLVPWDVGLVEVVLELILIYKK